MVSAQPEIEQKEPPTDMSTAKSPNGTGKGPTSTEVTKKEHGEGKLTAFC